MYFESKHTGCGSCHLKREKRKPGAQESRREERKGKEMEGQEAGAGMG